MDDRSLPQELKRWAIEEFGLQPKHLPHDTYFKTLCLGQGASIWKYVTQHVYHQRNVSVMRGNLQWYKMLQDTEVRQAEGQSEAARRQGLQTEIEEVRAEVCQLDSQISAAEEQLAAEDRLLRRSWGEAEDSGHRELLLQALGQRCREEKHTLTQDQHRASGHCQTLSHLCRKAEVELVFGVEASDSSGDCLALSGPEPQVLRDVRNVCEDRVLFFQSLQESELKTLQSSSSLLSREQRSVVFQHWLSAVEDLLRAHPPGHVLSALQYLASRQQVALQERLSSLDVEREVAALRFRYESNHLEDISRKEEELPSVKSLLQSGWEEVERSLMELAHMQSRVQQHKQQLNTHRKEADFHLCGSEAQIETLARSVFELELQCVVKAAVRTSVQGQCVQLAQQAKDRQEALRNLRSQWQSIMDFRQLVDRKQEQIRALIKANSNAKTELSRVHAEIRQFVQGTLGPGCWGVLEAARALRSSVTQEVRLAGAVSVAALNRRLMDGGQRVPAERLSMHRLHSPAFQSLCQSLAFPAYQATEQLAMQAVSRQEELLFLRRLQANLHHQGALLPAPDLQALLQRIREVDHELLQSLLPRVRQLSERASQGLLFGSQAKSAIAHWWEQPAQRALPELQRGGLTLQQWLHRWRLAAKALE
ncbi:HAUS augmin-like complex subunit 5 [Megalops cyprinoides]|uniref:HAUS augmin-like complex subunit 5 n=1 Tax=Megalops cyprinoides TaxID=118141 RepID=UPI00186409D1|nr:HAUS augmin-like complex subunit 5 [Megalops cyprinoides]